MTDLSYRNALKLEADRFLTSSQLSDTPILGEIQKLMMPDMRDSIRAELYKLNIYSGPGGHFKAPHHYVFQDLNCTEDLPYLLNSADKIVYMAGIALGLPVTVIPVATQVKHIPHHLCSKQLPVFPKVFPVFPKVPSNNADRDDDKYLLPKFSEFCTEIRDEDEGVDDETFLKTVLGGVQKDKTVTWCQPLTNLQPAAAYFTCRILSFWDMLESVSCSPVYQAAVILIKVPNCKEGKHQGLCVKFKPCISEELSEPCRKKQRSEEAGATIFNLEEAQRSDSG